MSEQIENDGVKTFYDNLLATSENYFRCPYCEAETITTIVLTKTIGRTSYEYNVHDWKEIAVCKNGHAYIVENGD